MASNCHSRVSIVPRALAVLGAISVAMNLAGAAKENVRLAVGSRPGNIVYLQIDLARALGYFEQEGVDVTFKYFDAGTAAADALVARDFDLSANSIDHAITRRAAGQELLMVASFMDLPCVT